MDEAASEEIDDEGGLELLVVALGAGTVDGISDSQGLLAASGMVEECDGKARAGFLNAQYTSAIQRKLATADQGVFRSEYRRSRPVAMRLPEWPDVAHEAPSLG